MSLVELVAKGEEDLFLTSKPQMTFFKAVYRRSTVFSFQQIPQTFLNTPDFGKKTPCIINRIGDLISDIVLVITIPSISRIYNADQTVDKYTRFAWIRKLGFGIIKNIDIKIGDKVIQQFTGEWINAWYELNKEEKDFNKIIGNIPELFNYDYEKDEYTLYIPLPFWFSKSPSLVLPLCCLKNHNVEVLLELEDLNKCYKLSPTHYILMNDYVCQFEQDEYIVQTIDDTTIVGQFAFFDYTTRRMYYSQITKELFKLADSDNDKYLIKGLKSNIKLMPLIKDNSTEQDHKYSIVYTHQAPSNIKVKDCYLLVDYVFIDDQERERFYSHAHNYIIEQVNETITQNISSTITSCSTGLKDPITYLVWYCKQNIFDDMYNNDKFNFTNSYQYNDILYKHILQDDYVISNNNELNEDVLYYIGNNKRLNDKYNHKQTGSSLIKNCRILFNGNEVINESYCYFHNIQSYNHFNCNNQTGLCVYSFAIEPLKLQPSGSCNMNKIDNVKMELTLDNCINTNNTCTFKCYSVSYNWLRIKGGYGGLLFIN